MNKSNGRERSGQEMPELSLRDILSPLFRHRRIVIGTFWGVFLLSIIVAWAWAARYYVANMQVVVEQDRSDPAITSAQVANVNNNRPVTTDQVTSEVALLLGDDMLRKVVTACGVVDDKRSVFDVFAPSDPQQRLAMREESAAKRLAKAIKVETAGTASDVIDVKYGRVGEPEVPACVLQTLGKLYLEKHLQLQRPAGASDFFAQETEKYRQSLADAEARLTDFSKTAGVASPDILRGDMAKQIAISEATLYQTRQTIAADQKRIEEIDKQMAVTPARSATSEEAIPATDLMAQLQSTLLTEQLKRSQLMLKYADDYPLVKEIDEEIAETKAAISRAENANYMNKTSDRDPTYEFLRVDRAKTQTDLASQRATAAALATSIDGMKAQTVDFDADAVKQGALLREAKADEANYLLYLSKREQERTSDALDQKRIANVAIAVPPVTPILPAHSPWLVMFLGLFGAIVASIVAAYLAEYLDPSFRTPEEVTDTLKMPVLATMPKRAA